MKYSVVAASLLAATASADNCVRDSYNNAYCEEVNAITYTNVGGSGSFKQVSLMDGATGACQFTPKSYSGNLSPLDGQVSMHFRGPMVLNQFAVYMPNSPDSKLSKPKIGGNQRREHVSRHARHMHHQEARNAQPGVGDWVTANINGKIVSWINEYAGGAAPTPVPQPPSGGAAAAAAKAPSAPAAPVSRFKSNYKGDGWARQAYYNASTNGSAGKTEGLVFLNHKGGEGSGCWDTKFGNSLSYASADGKSGSKAATVPAGGLWDDDTEMIIMSDVQCSASDGNCAYYRPDTVAHKGFDGPRKAFVMEFSMPNSGKTARDKYSNADMPAVWMLNAEIPRAVQYGDCSCWKSGCGEFDIMEVLSPGYDKTKSTMHGNKAGGDSNYIARPVDGPVKVAVLMYDDNIHIKKLSNDFNFDDGLTPAEINQITTSTMNNGPGVSLFSLLGAVSGFGPS